MAIQRAVISVYDKTGAVEFARSLHATVNSSREMRKKT